VERYCNLQQPTLTVYSRKAISRYRKTSTHAYVQHHFLRIMNSLFLFCRMQDVLLPGKPKPSPIRHLELPKLLKEVNHMLPIANYRIGSLVTSWIHCSSLMLLIIKSENQLVVDRKFLWGLHILGIPWSVSVHFHISPCPNLLADLHVVYLNCSKLCKGTNAENVSS
jgi:hypothetical protein